MLIEELPYKTRRSDWYSAFLFACLAFGILAVSFLVHDKEVSDKTRMLSVYLKTSLTNIERDIDSYFSDNYVTNENEVKRFLKQYPNAEVIIGYKENNELDFKRVYTSTSTDIESEVLLQLLPRIKDHSVLSRDYNNLFVVEQSQQAFLGRANDHSFIWAKLLPHHGKVTIVLVFYDLNSIIDAWTEELASDGLIATYVQNEHSGSLLAHTSPALSKDYESFLETLAQSHTELVDYKNTVLSVSHLLYPDRIYLISLLLAFASGLCSIIFFLKALLLVRYDLSIKRKLAQEHDLHEHLQNEIKKLDKDYNLLKKNAREYRHVLDSISDIVFETDMNGYVLFMNETWERATEIPAWDVIKTPLWQLFHPEDREAVRLLIESYIAGHRYASYEEARLSLNDGTYKMVEISLNMVRIPDNQDICLVGSMTDIDHRVRSEEALREAEEKYRNMVEKSLGGIYRAVPEGYFIDANPAMAQILGYDSVKELLESITDINEQFYCDASAREKTLEKVGGEGLKDIESRVYKKDGSVIWISESFRPIYGENDTILYYEGTIVDITKRKVIEAALLKAKSHSDMASRSKSEFLANMSHELRTPLNAIIGFSEILKDELFGPLGAEEYKEYSGDIYNSGTHLLQIINDILDMSKIEAGKRELREDLIRIKDVSLVAFKMVKPKADSKSVTLENLISDDLPPLLAEQLAVKQILINLLTNAVKFTHEGGNVKLTTDFSDKGELIFSVSDNGIGMREEDIEKALSAFGQIDGDLSKKESGTGLGLTLVKQLTELHGGRIKVESEVGKGTTVHVYFPAERVHKEDSHSQKATN